MNSSAKHCTRTRDVVIATKAGFLRTGPDVWRELGYPRLPAAGVRDEPAQARRGHASTCSSCTASTTSSPLEDQLGELVALQQEGKIRHIGLSEVNVDQLRAAQKTANDRVGAEHVQPDLA